MPSKFDQLGTTPAVSKFDQLGSLPSPSSRGSKFDQLGGSTEDSSLGWGTAGGALLGAGALAVGGYYAYKNPASVLGKVGSYANAARQQLMLSGLAVPKSLLGNTGAVVARSLEEKSLTPLREFFSMKTLQDAKDAYKAGSSVGPMMGQVAGANIPGPMPGKIMGAFDTATQGALQRSGMTPTESAAALFQTPIGGRLGEALNSPVAKYVFPFRRTPFNQFFEGLETIKPGYAHKGITAGYAGAGALHGAATSDEQYPMTLPLAAAASAKYGVPYAGAALIGRMLAGGKGSGGVTGSILPVSEYGTEQSLTDPLAPFAKPSGLRVLEKLFGSK